MKIVAGPSEPRHLKRERHTLTHIPMEPWGEYCVLKEKALKHLTSE